VGPTAASTLWRREKSQMLRVVDYKRPMARKQLVIINSANTLLVCLLVSYLRGGGTSARRHCTHITATSDGIGGLCNDVP
jgi:hypothetical protein